MNATTTDDPHPTEISLPIEGMTCASCVNRIERFLTKTPGVDGATVNLATEMATIRYQPDVADRAALVQAIESAGYDVRRRLPKPLATREAVEADRRPSPTAFARGRRALARASRAPFSSRRPSRSSRRS